MVKNLPAVRKTQVQSLGWEDAHNSSLLNNATHGHRELSISGHVTHDPGPSISSDAQDSSLYSVILVPSHLPSPPATAVVPKKQATVNMAELPAILRSQYPLSSPSSPALNLSQNQGLFK